MQGVCEEAPVQQVQRAPTGRPIATLASLQNPHGHFIMANLLLYSHTSTAPSVKGGAGRCKPVASQLMQSDISEANKAN